MNYPPLTDAEMERMKQCMIRAMRDHPRSVMHPDLGLAVVLSIGIGRSKIAPTPSQCRDRGAACFYGPARDCRVFSLHYFIIAIRRWRDGQPV